MQCDVKVRHCKDFEVNVTLRNGLEYFFEDFEHLDEDDLCTTLTSRKVYRTKSKFVERTTIYIVTSEIACFTVTEMEPDKLRSRVFNNNK